MQSPNELLPPGAPQFMVPPKPKLEKSLTPKETLLPPSPLLGKQPPKLGITGKQYSLSPNEFAKENQNNFCNQISLCISRDESIESNETNESLLTPPSPRSPQLGRPKLGIAGRQSSLCPNVCISRGESNESNETNETNDSLLTPPSPRSPVRSPQLGRPKLGMAGRQSSLCPNEIASENLLTPPSPLAARGMLGRQPPKLGVTGKQYSLSPNELLPPRSPMLGRQLSLCSPTRGALRRQNTIDPYSGKVCSSLNTISLKKKKSIEPQLRSIPISNVSGLKFRTLRISKKIS